MNDIDVKDLFECGLDILNSRVAEFYNVVGISKDNVIVLLVGIALLKLSEIFAELMCIERGPSDLRAFVFDAVALHARGLGTCSQ